LRVRGFSTDDFEDGDLLTLEERVWDTIMLFTNRVFENRNLTLKLDGNGLNELSIPEAIHTISSVVIDSVDPLIPGTHYVVYNRSTPDDRENPRILLLYGLFPEGYQNVTVTGVFGYTDPNSVIEFPPTPLIEVAMRMMPIFAESILEGAEREVDVATHKRDVKREATDRWSITRFDRKGAENAILDDPLMGAILMQYRKCNDSIFGDWV